MGKILNIVSFVEGRRNGDWYDYSDISELVQNFKMHKGYWNPYVSVNHERDPAYAGLSMGDVVDARIGWVEIDPATNKYKLVDKRGSKSKAALVLDCDNVPEEICKLYQSNRLRAPSIEFFDDDAPFIDQDENEVTTNVLKSLSLMGAQSEASKGMPKAYVEFADGPRRAPRPRHKSGRIKIFGAYPMDELMTEAQVETGPDRLDLIAQLEAAGFPVEMITDDTPTEMLSAILSMTANTMGDCDEKMMGDYMEKEDKEISMMADEVEKDMGKIGVPKAFSDKVSKLVEAAKQKAKFAKVARYNDRSAKAAKIKRFSDRMLGIGGTRAFMTPVQFKSIEPMLLKLDDSTVKQFGDSQMTSLDHQISRLEQAYSAPVKTFGDRMTAPHKAVDDYPFMDALRKGAGIQPKRGDK